MEASPESASSEQGGDSLMDLISGYAQEGGETKSEAASTTESKPKGKGKK